MAPSSAASSSTSSLDSHPLDHDYSPTQPISPLHSTTLDVHPSPPASHSPLQDHPVPSSSFNQTGGQGQEHSGGYTINDDDDAATLTAHPRAGPSSERTQHEPHLALSLPHRTTSSDSYLSHSSLSDLDADSDDEHLTASGFSTGPLSPSEDGPPPLEESAEHRRERRRRERRVYGGGRHRHGAGRGEEGEYDEGGERGSGDMGVGEVGGLVLAGSLSPTPLLLPFACARLGPALFVPLLALAGLLGWLSALVIGAEGRYVGARSFPALASAVFPHRLKLHLLGELLASLFVVLASLVRTTLDVVAAAEVAVDLVVPEHRRRDWEREVVVVGVCAVWLLVPLVLPPLLRLLSLDPFFPSLCSSSSSTSPSARYSRLASTSSPDLSLSPYPSASATSAGPPAPGGARRRARWTALLSLPAWSVALSTWPLALLILGVRLKRLNRDALSSASLLDSLATKPHLPPILPNPTDQSGLTLWPAMLLPFAALVGATHETFFYFTSLARPSSTSSVGGGGGGGGRRRGTSFSGDLPGGFGSEEGGQGGAGGRGRQNEGRRNQYPLALALGLGGSFLIHLGWALVGSLGLSSSLPSSSSSEIGRLPAADLLSDPRLPRGDAWLNAVRVLVLVGVLSSIQGHARFAIGRVRRGLSWAVPPLPLQASSSSSAAAAAAAATTSGWRDLLARLAVWAAVAALSFLVVAVPALARGGSGGRGEVPAGGEEGEGEGVGGHGNGLVYATQWMGVLGAGVGGCLGPAIAYLTLFHLRPPRTIFTSSPSSPSFTSDVLLQRKERQLQRRLSGRRLWTDVGVFGLLGPVGVVLVGRGVWALVGVART
ncbi:hypothetical protein JCM8097_007160 [Rhodosporidiobolus ruineniae]